MTEEDNREGFGLGAILATVAIIAVAILVITLTSDSPILEMVGVDRSEHRLTERVLAEAAVFDPHVSFANDGELTVISYQGELYVSIAVAIDEEMYDADRYDVRLLTQDGMAEILGSLTHTEEESWTYQDRLPDGIVLVGSTLQIVAREGDEESLIAETDIPEDITIPQLTDEVFQSTVAGYVGDIRAGNAPMPLLSFNQTDYDKALQEKILVLLYFTNPTCEVCQEELQTAIDHAFRAMRDNRVIGFAIPYDDGEQAATLAEEYEVTEVGTKVFLYEGEMDRMSADPWDKAQYESAIREILPQT